MNKLYGGIAVDTTQAKCNPATWAGGRKPHGAGRDCSGQLSTHRVQIPNASTPYTREEVAFADAYAREQMQDGLTPEAG